MAYEVIGRYMNCADIIGVKLRDLDTKSILKVKYKEFEKLVKQNKINNFKVITEDKEYIVGSKISDIEIEGLKGTYSICDRITNDNGEIIGYELIEESTYKKEKVDIKTAWQLAFNGSLKGVRAVYKKLTDESIKKLILVDNVVEI